MDKEIIEIKCIECGKDCPEPFIFQSSDIFSQSWIRVCDIECFYGLTSEFLYSIYEHKNFYRWLDKKENETDRKMRRKRTDKITDESLKDIGEYFKKNKYMSSRPCPKLVKALSGKSLPEAVTSVPMKFKRYNVSIKDRIEGTKDRIRDLEEKLKRSKDELKELKN